jgi:hypothetical protein
MQTFKYLQLFLILVLTSCSSKNLPFFKVQSQKLEESTLGEVSQNNANNQKVLETPEATDLNSEIHEAAKAGNKNLVDQLLAKEANINIAVEAAAEANQVELVHNLLNRGASLGKAIEGSINYKYKIKKLNKPGSHDVLLLNELLAEEDDLKDLNLSRLVAYAAIMDDKETVEILFFNRGASLKIAIVAAHITGKDSLMREMLIQEQDKDFSVWAAASFNKDDIMWYLLKKGASKKEAIRGVKSRDKIDQSLIKKIQSFKNQ